MNNVFAELIVLGFQVVHRILDKQDQRISALEKMHGIVSDKIGGSSSDPEAAE